MSKPSERSKSQTKPVSLNITPYLDIVTSIMLFMMVTSTGLVQIGVINVNAPRYSDPIDADGASDDDEKKDEKKLNLTIGIMHQGLFVAGAGAVLGSGEENEEASEEQPAKPTIPLLTTDPACVEALAKKTPPPASCYDYERLTAKMVEVKDGYPQNTKIFIFAQPDVPYEILIKVMDATRQTSKGRALFYDVIISAAFS